MRLALLAAALLAAGCATPLERARSLDPTKPIPTLLLSQVIVYEEHSVAELALAGQTSETLDTLNERLLTKVEATLRQHGLALRDDPTRPPAFVPGDDAGASLLEGSRSSHPRGTVADLFELSERSRAEVVAGRGLRAGEAGVAVSVRLRLEDDGRKHQKVEARLELLALDPGNRRLLHAVGSGTHALPPTSKLPPPLEALEAALDVALMDIDRKSREPVLVE